MVDSHALAFEDLIPGRPGPLTSVGPGSFSVLATPQSANVPMYRFTSRPPSSSQMIKGFA